MAGHSNRIRDALLASTALIAGAAGSTTAFAQNILPTQGAVAAGAASIRQSGAAMSVTQTSQRAVINWNSFSIGQTNSVTFQQPGASSAVLNRVTGSARSSLAGSLQANGQVYLVNPNGIAITPTGTVRVGGGFVASTLDILNKDFMHGKLDFNGDGSSAGVDNAGSITVGSGGFVGLIGGTVSNSGVVTVPLGKVGMGSGEQATLNLTGDNFLQVAVPTNTKTADGRALVDVSGKVVAAGGSVQLKAATVAQAIRNAVNVPGSLSVSSASARGGSIILSGGPGGDVAVAGRLAAAGRTRGGSIAINGHNVALRRAKLVASSGKGRGGSVVVTGTNAVSLASTSVDVSGATGGGAIRIGGDFHGAGDLTSARTTTIDQTSTLNASATASGNGGTVAVWSQTATGFAGTISATGGPNGGDGGYAEVSANPAAHGVLTDSGFADLTAPKGKTGTLLLDPFDITICLDCDDVGGAFSGGLYTPTATSFISTTTLDAQLVGANVVVSTGLAGSPGSDEGNVLVAAPVTWGSDNNLTLDAAGSIVVEDAITATGAGSLTLTAAGLTAGTGFVSVFAPLSTTTGAIALTGPAGINLGADVTTTGGAVTFNNPVQLEGGVTVNSGTGAVTFGGTVDSITEFSGPCAGGCDLTVTASTINFGGAVGGLSALGAVSFTATGPLTTPSITTTRDITLSSGGFASVSGALSTTGGDVSVTGATGIGLAANVTTTAEGGDVTFNDPVQLRGDITVDATGEVTFASTVDSDPAFPGSGLTVSAVFADFGGSLGATNPLGAVSLTSTDGLFLPSITATGNITLNNPASLDGDITTSGGNILFADTVTLETGVTISAPTGAVTFDSTVDTDFSTGCAGGCDLSVAASTINFGGALGGENALGAVSLISTNAMTLPSITATSILAQTTGPAANLTVGLGATLNASPITLESNAGGIVIFGAIQTSGNVILNAAEDIVESINGESFGAVTAATLAATSTGGRVVMTDFENEVPSVSGSAPGGFSFYTFGVVGEAAPTGLNVGAAGITSSGGSIALGTVEGPITQTGPVRGLALWALAGDDGNGDVILNNPNNAVGTVAGSASGNFQFADNNGANLTIGTVNYFLSSEAGGPNPTEGYGVFAFGGGTTAPTIQITNVGNIVLGSANPDFPDTAPVDSFDPTGTIVLAATGNFINNFGPGAIVESEPETDPWQIYSASPAGDVFGGLDSGNTAVWNTTLGEALPPAATGNRYVFAFQPTITVASINDAKTYGEDVTARVATDYTITGLEVGVAGAFLGDTAAAVYSGTPLVTSLGSPARAPVAGSPYAVTVAAGSFAVADGYALVLDSAGVLAVGPREVTYSVADATSIYGTTAVLGAATLTNIVPGDTVTGTVEAFSGGTQIVLGPRTPAGLYSEEVTALSSPDYFVAPTGNTPGTLTIDPRPITYAVADANSIYGVTPVLGAATLTGVLAGDAVDPTVSALSGGSVVALGPRTPAGVYSQEVTALSNANYTIAITGNTPGNLTVDPRAITFAVADATSVFGVTPVLGAATLFGVLPGDVVVPAVGAFRGLTQVVLTPFTPVGQYAQLVTAISNPNYSLAAAPNFPGVLTILASGAVNSPSDPGFLPGLTQINNPEPSQLDDVGGFEQVLPRFAVNCNEPPTLPDPNRFSDPDAALRALSHSVDSYFKHCQNPTQETIANALDAYAAKLQILAPRLPPALRNVPGIIAEGARRARAARSRSEAAAVLHQTVAAVHKAIALVLSEDPQTRGRELRDGEAIESALVGASVALVNSGGL